MADGPFALVDCNNFYVSCERVFNPALQHRPVVVLSNNDGCAVARSNEVKRLGIKMGAPLFEFRDLVAQHNIEVLSSNYSLYGDMSNRVMQIVQGYSPLTEVYSIDEIFLNLKGMPFDLEAWALKLKKQVLDWTGIPVSVGIGATKTLAKVANRMAKKNLFHGGVFELKEDRRIEALKALSIEEVWGIGSRWGKSLRSLGIQTAYDLTEQDYRHIQKQFNVVLARTALELGGLSCMPLEVMVPRKQIRVSRSFGERITKYEPIREALSSFTARAAEKLRAQGSLTQAILVFIQTNRFNEKEPQHHQSIVMQLPVATDDTIMLLKAARKGLEKIYKPNHRYKKTGIILLDLTREANGQNDLFFEANPKRQALMEALDQCHEWFGRKSLHFASEGVKCAWQGRRGYVSAHQTTSWENLPKVYAK